MIKHPSLPKCKDMHPIVEECKQVSKSTTTMYHEYPKQDHKKQSGMK